VAKFKDFEITEIKIAFMKKLKADSIQEMLAAVHFTGFCLPISCQKTRRLKCTIQ
jgi:hypothetical protein